MGRTKRTKSDKIEDKVKVDNNYKCSECQNSFNAEKDANIHILKEHYGLARINDENKTPFTENEIIKALIKAQKVVKVLKCKNSGCNKSFKSGLGLKMHLDLCGKSENELQKNCDICGKLLKISSVLSHMKIHDEEKRCKDNLFIDDSIDGSKERPTKRASAIKASKSFKKAKGELIISGNVSDTELLSDPEFEPKGLSNCETTSTTTTTTTVFNKLNVEQMLKKILVVWQDFITSSKDFLRPIPKDHNWTNEVLINGIVVCPLENCNQEFSTKGGLEYHYKRCGIDIKFSFRCKLCNFEANRGNRTIVQHLWSCHKQSLPTLPSELSETLFTFDNSLAQPKSQIFTKKDLNLIGTINHVLEFHERHYKEKAFQHLVPTIYSWSTLDEKENAIYIPNSNPSAFFKSTLSESNSWQRLNLFDSMCSPNHITFFVGGPVWSSSWCPLPINVNNCDQYIAIGSSMNMDSTHFLNDTEMECGLIQIWNTGKLGKTFDASVKPRLALSIAHSNGMIWDMEWCPGGTAWEDMNGVKDMQLEILPRLGLLAIACGDGYVRIHSIPHPEALPQSYQNSLYYNEPIIKLNPPGVGNSTNYETTICKCISWIKSNNQHLIAGGFGSGLIAVWDLTTTSTLLIVKKTDNQTILRPYNSWLGHSAAVTRIKWVSNSSKQYIASCSFDRTTKLWNLRDLTIPLTTIKKGLFTAIDIHLQWCGIFMANDDCYQGFQNNVMFKDFGYLNFNSNLLTCHKSCIWDLSFSEWATTAVSVDAAGEAVIYPNFQLRSEQKSKRRPFDRIPLYNISLLSLNNEKDKQIPNNNKKQTNIDLIIDPKEPPLRSYTEFSSKYGLVFNDFSLTHLKSMPMEAINRIRLPTHMQYQRLSDYPLISLNKVSWNPNFSSCTWIFTASQSGLCRLSCLPSLDPISNTTSIS